MRFLRMLIWFLIASIFLLMPPHVFVSVLRAVVVFLAVGSGFAAVFGYNSDN